MLYQQRVQPESESLPDVAHITALDGNPVLRNLLITQGYFDLSEALARRLGRENITWPTMAGWSSKSVGGFIRGEEFPSFLQKLLRLPENEQEGVTGLVARILQDVSRYLIQGNRIVFAEVAEIVSGFVRTFSEGAPRDDGKLEEFLARYTDGMVQPDEVQRDPETRELSSTQRGGQTLLKEALRSYYQALFMTDKREKAQLILLGNARIGVHEQTRLQPYLVNSMDSALDNIIYNADEDSWLQRRFGKGLEWLRTVLTWLLRPLGRLIWRVSRHLATAEMMSLKLPDGVIGLGSYIQAMPGQPLFPEVLQHILLPELRELLKESGALDKGLSRPGIFMRALGLLHSLIVKVIGLKPHMAHADWTNRKMRMQFILTLFRSRQQDKALFTELFSKEQTREIRAGKVPLGELS
jgi:hypothetical protein